MADLGWCKTHDLPGDEDSSCCWKCRGEIEAARQAKRDSALAAAREAGRREGYAACTADVVAWLRSLPGTASDPAAQMLVVCFQRGEHVGAAGKGKP